MKLNKGFTLIELIVVMAVFLFIVGVALGIFISIITSQRKVLAEQQFLNQIGYVEEYMSKALRAAKTDKEGDCINNGDIYQLTHWSSDAHNGIKFINANNNDNTCQEFYFSNGILYEKKGTGSPVEVALTSFNNLKINFVKFVINGDIDILKPNFPSDFPVEKIIQPKVTILLNIEIPGENQTRTIQTTVSRRTLNVQQ